MRNLNYVLAISSIYSKLPNSFVERFTTVEQKRFDNYVPLIKDTIFHSNLSLVEDAFEENLQKEDAVGFIKNYKIRRFSFDVGPCYKQFKILDNKYIGIGKRLSLKEIFELCEEKIGRLRSQIPDFCELAVENLNYYNTGAYEDICEPDFYNQICKRFNLGLVFDIAHAHVSAYNKNMDFNEYLIQFDFDNIKEFHLSKIKIIDEKEAIDFHEMPDEKEFEIIYDIIKNSNTQYDVIVEYWQDAVALIETYNGLEAFFAKGRL